MRITITLLFIFFLFAFCQAQITMDQEYITLDVYTGDLPGAGTDRTVDLSFRIGGEEVRIEDLTTHINGNALERATSDRFTYPVPNMGDIDGINVYVDFKNIVDDSYFLDKVIVTKPDGTKYRFECNCWLNNENHIGYSRLVSESDSKAEVLDNRVTVKIKTSKISKSGTNANVYLSVKTEHGHSSPIKLNTKITGNAFENDDLDIVHINLPRFKEIHSINIRHDNKGAGAGWNLERITIIDPAKKEFVFDCNCWLEGDNNQKTLLHQNYTGPNVYFFQSAIGGKFLDVQWGSDKEGTPLHLWEGNKGKAQQFYLDKVDANRYTIKSALGNNLFLYFRRSEAKATIHIGNPELSGNTIWYFEKLEGTNYYLIKNSSGLCIDVQWAANKNGTPIWLWNKNAGAAQQWKILTEENGTLVPADPY